MEIGIEQNIVLYFATANPRNLNQIEHSLLKRTLEWKLEILFNT